MPEKAVIKGGNVFWEDKRGAKKKGKLTQTKNGEPAVLVETKYWIAKFTDENGKQKSVATKMTNREAAQKLLNTLENDVERIRSKVVTREELDRTSASAKEIGDYVEKFRVKMVASSDCDRHIRETINRINSLFAACSITRFAHFEKTRIEEWIAKERELSDEELAKRKKRDPQAVKRAPRTINSYLVAVRSFANWCVESGFMAVSPMKRIKNLNEAVGRKKDRRSFTEGELKAIFDAAKTRRYAKGKNKGEEHALVYRLLAGTGLRSSELGMATVDQFDFDRCRFRVKAARTKNKKDDVLPVRPDLIAMLKEWVTQHGIKPGERIFKYSRKSIHSALKIDLKAAGIPQKGEDGRSVDVHSLRRTFGTMLARAGVPLTTTQRLMRHSTPELTAKLYIDVDPIDMQQAIDKLPSL